MNLTFAVEPLNTAASLAAYNCDGIIVLGKATMSALCAEIDRLKQVLSVNAICNL